MAQSMTAPRRFIPAMPTLWPHMLLPRRATARVYPFAAPDLHTFYFARNGVWHAAKMFDLDQGEVLVPAYHHGVEIEALIDAGAQVRFYRVGRRWDVDLDDVARQIGPRTRALYLTHYAGFPGPVAAMRALADQHGLPLIEDCALALLSADGARPLGATGDVGIFCLYKTLPVPNGGALTVNRPHPYAFPPPERPSTTSLFSHTVSALLQNIELRGGTAGRWVRDRVRQVGRRTVETANIARVTTGSDHFEPENLPLGMSALSARIIAAQDLDRIVAIRRRNYQYLLDQLGDAAPPLFDQLPPGVCPLFYPLIVEDKELIMDRLAAQGIETIDFWRFFHPACAAADFPDVAWLRDHILEIPCHQDVSRAMLDVLVPAVRTALNAPARPGRVVGAGAQVELV